MKKTLLVTLIFIFTVVAVSCSKDGGGGGGGTVTVDCNTVTNKAFAADVNPIIQASCSTVGCHATNGNGPGALTNYTQISGAASSIRTAVSSGRMPQGSSLTTAQKNSIICWVNSGSPNN
jgi:hypothetical protein